MASQPIYQLYAELCDYKPKIWRRFQVMNNITMARLGYIVMTLFEMQASHLFCFNVPQEENFYAYMRERCSDEEYEKYFGGERKPLAGKRWRFEIPMEDTLGSMENEELYDATAYKVKDAVSHPNAILNMEYDYGDSWEISLILEEIIVDKEIPGSALPRVLDGEGYGIIEDCGGVDGLEEIAQAFKKKKGVDYEAFCEWLGRDDLDLAAFDRQDMNFRLKKVPRIYSDIYELRYAPTQKSMDILERKYLRNPKK